MEIYHLDAVTYRILFATRTPGKWYEVHRGEDGEAARSLFTRLARMHDTPVGGQFAPSVAILTDSVDGRSILDSWRRPE